MAITITRVPMTNDDGSKTTGTIFDNAWLNASIYDKIDAMLASAVSFFTNVNNFRLTLTTGLPVTPSDVTAATTIRCTPYNGNLITLFDAAGVPTVFSSPEMSIAVPATASQMYDIFGFNNAGTPTLELLAWTNDTTRATALTLATTGCYTKSGNLTRRYLGSFRTTAVSGQTEDSHVKRYLWNYYNRVPRGLRRLEATATWNYSLTTWRQANAGAGTANQLDVVVGVAEVPVDISVCAAAFSSAADAAFVSIGEDSTTTPSPSAIFSKIQMAAANLIVNPTARLTVYPAVGRHTYVWLEQTAAVGTMTWAGANSGVSAVQSGMLGTILG